MALYRRYRPETFAEVIGQEHVTQPLQAALAANRVTHAYLFSGPRGCGKTTSARILARCLNCAAGPTAQPCGECDSCRELATGGSGSLDVVEIDAASHNGVDDARELRERAAFAPVRDRYKVFILDEAHMVTPQGFNALLKLVEEPPEHVKFVFATTEPEKVIGTIRSRTHHYPFRLVPPDTMGKYLAQLCEREEIAVAEGVLPLVVRAGGGSVRDSLSVLDQLMAGAVAGELDYSRAVTLLGYTEANLLDEMVLALGNSDGAGVFSLIERVVESGHDPRRFVEDFLQRLRDLLILAVGGERAEGVLGGIPQDQLQRMREQAQLWGAAGLSRAADQTAQALTNMVGATSPRLQLELLCGRILVTATGLATGTARGASAPVEPMKEPSAARVTTPSAPPKTPTSVETHRSNREKIARPARSAPRVEVPQPEIPQPPPAEVPIPAWARVGAQPQEDAPAAAQAAKAVKPEPRQDEVVESPAVAAALDPALEVAPETAAAATAPAQAAEAPVLAATEIPVEKAEEPAAEASDQPVVPPETSASSQPAEEPTRETAGHHAEEPAEEAAEQSTSRDSGLAAKWGEALARIGQMRLATAALLTQHARLLGTAGDRVTLGFSGPGLVAAFQRGGHQPVVEQVLSQMLARTVSVQAVTGDELTGPDSGAASIPVAPEPPEDPVVTESAAPPAPAEPAGFAAEEEALPVETEPAASPAAPTPPVPVVAATPTMESTTAAASAFTPAAAPTAVTTSPAVAPGAAAQPGAPDPTFTSEPPPAVAKPPVTNNVTYLHKRLSPEEYDPYGEDVPPAAGEVGLSVVKRILQAEVLSEEPLS